MDASQTRESCIAKTRCFVRLAQDDKPSQRQQGKGEKVR
jgi:hypothetical protein